MVKLTDIARELNLNVSVISRALNPCPDKHAVVKPETRELIMQTAKRLGYRPNRFASYLKRGKVPTLLCFLPDRADRLIADLTFGISEQAAECGFAVNFLLGNDLSKFISFLKNPSQIGHCGVISYPPNQHTDPQLPEFLENYVQNGGKALLLNSYFQMPTSLSALVRLNIDTQVGANLAADHLLEQKCRRIFTVTETDWSTRRLQFFRQRIEQQGMPCPALGLTDIEALCKHTSDTPIGLFAEHDFCALNLIRQLKGFGINPGTQIKVVGYDDQLFAADTCLGLTSVHQPTREQGHRAVRILVNLINEIPETDQWISPLLKIRQSSIG